MSCLTTTDRGTRGVARACFMLLLVGIAGASSSVRGALIPLSVEELTHLSKHVVTGKVVRTRSYYEAVEDLGNVIYTDVTIRLTTQIVGTFQDKEMTLKVHGGVVGQLRQIWCEAPVFTEGELVLVFVREFKGRFMVTGWKQGKYRLSSDSRTVLGKGSLPIGRSIPLSTVSHQVKLYDTTRPPGSKTPDASRKESER